MNSFVSLAIFFVIFKSLWQGNRIWRVYVKAGYNTDWYEQTGQKIAFTGGLKEGFGNTIVGALGLIFRPGLFWLITAAQLVVLYVIMNFL